MEANLTGGEEEADGPDGAGSWRHMIKKLPQSAALRSLESYDGGAGLVVAAGKFLRIDQG
jgi:hypothetical protein